MKPITDTTDILQSRAILYAGISTVFTSPAEEKFRSLRQAEFQKQLINAAASYDGYHGNTKESIRKTAVDLIDAFYDEEKALDYGYINIFGHTLSKKTSPYELEHLQNQEIFYKTQSLADISGFYKAFGLQISAKERVDFIAVEAEFLSFLIIKELLARQNELDPEKLEVARNAQRDFFNDHFGGWAATFAKNVIEQAHISFYQNAGRLLKRLIIAETTYFREELSS